MSACIECGQTHKPEHPHDAMTPTYFAWCIEHKHHAPTWQDAIAHCECRMREFLKERLTELGKWTTHSKRYGRKNHFPLIAYASAGKEGKRGRPPTKRTGVLALVRSLYEEEN